VKHQFKVGIMEETSQMKENNDNRIIQKIVMVVMFSSSFPFTKYSCPLLQGFPSQSDLNCQQKTQIVLA
jgi:hypothetical protein